MPSSEETQKRRSGSRNPNDSLSTPTPRKGPARGPAKCQRPVISAEQWITNNLVKCGRLSCQPGQKVDLDVKEEFAKKDEKSQSSSLTYPKMQDKKTHSITLFSTESFGTDRASNVADDTTDENITDNLPAKSDEQTICDNISSVMVESSLVKDSSVVQSDSGDNSESDFVKMLEIEFDRKRAKTVSTGPVDESDTEISSQSQDSNSNQLINKPDTPTCIAPPSEISYTNMSVPQNSPAGKEGCNTQSSENVAQTMKNMKNATIRKQHRRSLSLQLTGRMSSDLSTIPEESDGKRHLATDDFCSSLESLRFEFRNTLPRAASLGVFSDYDSWAKVDQRSSFTTTTKSKNVIHDDVFKDIEGAKLKTPLPDAPNNKPEGIERRSDEIIMDNTTDDIKTTTPNKEERHNNKPIVPMKPKKGHVNFKKLKEAREHIKKSVNKTKKQTDLDTKSNQLGTSAEGVKHSQTKHDKESHSKRRVFQTKKARDANRCRKYSTQTSSENEIETSDEKSKKSASGHRTFSKYSRGVELFKNLRDKGTCNNVDNNNIVKDHSVFKDAHDLNKGIDGYRKVTTSKEEHLHSCVSTNSDMSNNSDVTISHKDYNNDGSMHADKTMQKYDICIENSFEAVPLNKELFVNESQIKKPIMRSESSESDYSIHKELAHNHDSDVSKIGVLDDGVIVSKETEVFPEKNGYFADTEIVDYRQEERTDDEIIIATTQFGNLNLNQEYRTDIIASNHHSGVIADAGLVGNTLTIHDESPSSDADFFFNSTEKESEERTDMTDDDTSDVKTDRYSTSMASFTEEISSSSGSSSGKQSAESLDALTVELDWKRRSYRRKRQDSEEGREWKARETRMTEKIQWLRTEIAEMKKQDQSLMRQFLQLRSTIHAMKRNQDNTNTSSSFASTADAQSCNFLQLSSTDNLSNEFIIRDFARFGSATSINNDALSNVCSNGGGVGGDQNGNLTSMDGTIEGLPEFRTRTVSLVNGSRSEVGLRFVKPRTMTFSSGSKHHRDVFETSGKEIAC